MTSWLKNCLSKGVVGVMVGMLACGTQAGEILKPSGSSATLGKVSTEHSVLSVRANPAASTLLVSEQEPMRYAYFNALGFGVEVGDFGDFEQEINDLVDELERDDIGIDEGQDLLDRFNAILPSMGRNGYIDFAFDVSVPLGPFVMHSEHYNGDFFIDVSRTISGSASLLDDEIEYTPQSSNQVVGSIDTDTAIYIKAANITKISGGYSREVLFPQIGGTIIAGASLNLYNVSLSKSVMRLQSFEGEEVSDVISDNYDRNARSGTGLGIDVGVLWQFDNWHAGMTIENINSPKFDYGSLLEDCTTLPAGSFQQENCFAANFTFSDRITLQEEGRMPAQTRVEGRYLAFNNSLSVAGYYELNKVYNILAIEKQMMGVSLNYDHGHWFYPTFRAGINKNLAGSELSQLSMGLSFFKTMHLDFSYSMDSTEVDGEEYPRAMSINLGFEKTF